MSQLEPFRTHAHHTPRLKRRVVPMVLAAAALLMLNGSARADAYGDVQYLYQNGHTEQALSQADAYIKQHPDDPQMRFIKANLLSREGDVAQAEAVLIELTQTYPELAEPWNNLAVLYADDGQLDAAQEALESALRIDPRYATALENMGDVRLQLAQQAYERSRQSGNDAARVERKIKALRALLQDTNSTDN